jgi:NAD(P)H-dependent FMN reductase
VYGDLGSLPLFNPDLECAPHPAVAQFRSATADALLMASPEYAHGISGVMKDALDWLVS